MRMSTIAVVGGGLAGCEAALALAVRGHSVEVVEMRPGKGTPAHQTGGLGELVCTNSFKSERPATAHGQLKREMECRGSVLLAAAQESRVPAGSALAVDRDLFSQAMTRRVEADPRVTVVREEAQSIPRGPVIVATGPLTSAGMAASISAELGDGGLAFYDAIAPIVHVDSVDRAVAFEAGRYQQEADYLNCPMDRREYDAFIEALRLADVHDGHDWDSVPYFEGCLPIEVMAARGPETLRFGPMKPVGLPDPRGEDPVVPPTETMPGLGGAEFLRWGSIYLNFPGCLTAYGSSRRRPEAGQLTGVEGYTESAASGILAGINLDRVLGGEDPVVPPTETMLGGLCRYLREAKPDSFQPMNSNWGLVDPLHDGPRKKALRREALADRADRRFREWIADAHVMPAGAAVP